MNGARDALQAAEILVFSLLGVVAALRWWRARGRARALIAATFVDLGLVVIVSAVLGPHPHGAGAGLVQRLIIVTLALFPFLLYCFARTFARTPRWLDAVAVALTAVAGFGSFAFRHLPAQGETWPAGYGIWVGAFLGQWTLLSAVVAARLWRAGVGQPTVSRRRMRTLSLGTIGLAVALIVAGAAPGNGKASVAQIVTQVLAVLSGPLFLTGFAPPRALLASWRRPELDELRAAEAALVAAQTPEEVGARLVPHVARIIGGRGALLLDGDSNVVGSYGLDATDVAEIAGQGSEASVVDHSLVRIPLSAGQLVVAATPYTPYFARDETGLIGNLGTLTDLALSRVRLAARERQVATELRAANEAMRDFVAIASHDLRTPITVIKGFAAMLDDNGLDESGLAEIRGTIARQADHLGDIVDDLLMSSRLEAGALTAQREVVEVAGVAREVAADLGFEVGISVPTGLCCCADPDHLRRMLTNYLQNARNYGQPPYSVRACDAGNEVEVRVCDRGPGLPAEFVPRAFEKFARADNPHAKQRKGTGLGLAIVRGLARLEGGEAWYEPNEPCGACFAISLPNQDDGSSMRRVAQ